MTLLLPRGKDFFAHALAREIDAITIVTLFHLMTICVASEKKIRVIDLFNIAFNEHFPEYLKGLKFQMPENERERALYERDMDGLHRVIKLHDRAYRPNYPDGEVHPVTHLPSVECDRFNRRRIVTLASNFGFPVENIWTERPDSLKSVVTQILLKMGALTQDTPVTM
jgi:hypothetical protein